MLKIKDPDHLSILMTVFFDAKFSPDPVTPDLQASPVVNRMYQQTIDAAKEAYAKQYLVLFVNQIDEHLQSTENNAYILPSVKARITRMVEATEWEHFNWEKLSVEERRTHIEQHITPFSFDEELIDRLVAFGDSLLAERTDS